MHTSLGLVSLPDVRLVRSGLGGAKGGGRVVHA